APVLLAAQLPPFSPATTIGDGCILHIDPTAPSTLILDGFTTNNAGTWAQAFLLAQLPELLNLTIMLQAGIVSPGGPLSYVHLTGTPSPLTADFVNATTTTTGTLGRLTAVLQLNISFNAAGLIGNPTPGFGSLIYMNPYNPLDSLNGLNLNQILGVSNQVVAG